MDDFPDFSEHSYRIEEELGHNRAGGRVTYLATDLNTQQQVVIKQFQFARLGATWSSFDTYDREIQLLKELNHPGIPRYLNSFQTADGFCMVQEYKKAESLATSRSYDPNEICQIAIAALEILVYLQNRVPPIIHRDIKPENILIDQQGNVYLVDFGFARVGEGEVGVSSVVKGTLGFMPPEQLFNRQLTEASDLYGLGMTLICLLTGTKSDHIGDLVDISYRVSFKHLAPKLNQQWINWLEKMVETRLKDRFSNALAALIAIPRTPLRPPEAQFSQSAIDLTATRPGEILSQTIAIVNPVPETILEGKWEVARHPHDPAVEVYQWIRVEPEIFSGNQLQFQILIDTRHLMLGKVYHRRLLLQANTLARTYPLNIQIETAHLPRSTDGGSLGLIGLLGFFFVGLGWLASWFTLVLGTLAGSVESTVFGTLVGSGIGLECATWLMRSSGWNSGTSTLLAVVLAGGVLTQVFSGAITSLAPTAVFLGVAIGLLIGISSGIAINITIAKLIVNGYHKVLAIVFILATTIFAISLGSVLSIGLKSTFIISILLSSSLVLILLFIKIQLQRMNHMFNHRKTKRYAIKP